MTITQREAAYLMLLDFATTNGFSFKYEYNAINMKSDISFKKNFFEKTYIINWPEVSSLFRAVDDITSDVLLMYARVYTGTDTKRTNLSEITDSIRCVASYGKGLCSEIRNVVFNDPATIVFWADGTKTVVKAENEKFDPEKGLAMAIAKNALGNKYEYYNVFKHWLKKVKPTNTDDHSKAWCAYQRLINVDQDSKATKIDLQVAIRDAITYLHEAMED